MEDLQAHLSKLNREGVVDSHGHFTLDFSRALEKLALFRFESPSHYILSLVRAVVMGGATRLVITVDADDVVLEFDGEVFQPDDLQALYGLLLAPDSANGGERMRHLAAGVHGGMQAGAKFLDIGCYRFFPGRLEPVRQELPTLPGDQRIHLKRAFGLQVLHRFIVKHSGPLPEAALIKDSCQFCPFDLYLNGQLLVSVSSESKDDSDPVQFCGQILADQPCRVLFIVGGVTTAVRSFPTMPGLQARVYVSLPLNFSQSDVLEGERYQAVLERLSDFYERFLLDVLVSNPIESENWTHAARTATRLLRLGSEAGTPAALLTRLEHHPIFPLAEPQLEEPAKVSLHDLRQAAQLYCIKTPLSPEALSQHLWPGAIRLRDEGEELYSLLEKFHLVWDSCESMERKSTDRPALLVQSEWRRRVLVYFGSARGDGQRIWFNTEKSLPLEFLIDSQMVRGPRWDGTVVELPWSEITRLDIDERTIPGQAQRFFCLAIGSGDETLIYDEGYDEFASIPQSMRLTNQRAQAALHAIPALLGRVARITRPELVPELPIGEFLQPGPKDKMR